MTFTAARVRTAIGEIISDPRNSANLEDAKLVDLLKNLTNFLDTQKSSAAGFDEKKIVSLQIGAVLLIKHLIYLRFKDPKGIYYMARVMQLVPSSPNMSSFHKWLGFNIPLFQSIEKEIIREFGEDHFKPDNEFVYISIIHHFAEINKAQLKTLLGSDTLLEKFLNDIETIYEMVTSAPEHISMLLSYVNNTPLPEYTHDQLSKVVADYKEYYDELRLKEAAANDPFLNQIVKFLELYVGRINTLQKKPEESQSISIGLLLIFSMHLDPSEKEWEFKSILYNLLLRALNLDDIFKISKFKINLAITDAEGFLNHELDEITKTGKLAKEWDKLPDAKTFLQSTAEKGLSLRVKMRESIHKPDWPLREWFKYYADESWKLGKATSFTISTSNLLLWLFDGGLEALRIATGAKYFWLAGKAVHSAGSHVLSRVIPLALVEVPKVKNFLGTAPKPIEEFSKVTVEAPDVKKVRTPPEGYIDWIMKAPSKLISPDIKERVLERFFGGALPEAEKKRKEELLKLLREQAKAMGITPKLLLPPKKQLADIPLVSVQKVESWTSMPTQPKLIENYGSALLMPPPKPTAKDEKTFAGFSDNECDENEEGWVIPYQPK